MIKNKGIAFKLILCILTSCIILFVCIFGYNYLFTRRIITGIIRQNAGNLTAYTVSEIETVLKSVEKVPQNIAYSLEQTHYTKEALLNLLRSVVESNPEIYGATIAFEPYAFNKDIEYFAPYYYRRNGEVKYRDLADKRYEYINWDWYKIPKRLNRPVWSEPYYDEGGGDVIMTTYSVPFYKTGAGEKKLMGIVTADIYLSWLHDMISSIKIGETGYGFLISRDGTIVTHPQQELIMNVKLHELAEKKGDHRLIEIVEDMINGASGFVPSKSLLTGKRCWLAYKPIPTSGWSLGVLFPQTELMSDMNTLSKNVSVLGLLGILILVLIIVLIAGTITRPLRRLANKTKDIAKGNLDCEMPPTKSGDEVGRLTDSFKYMKNALKKYITKLTETTAIKERMESELKVGHDIQMGIVPKVFPERAEFTIHALLEPAREVGGDLYDFFFVDDDHLCFVIGDVSGKGVPAALFMAMTITLIKATAKTVSDPAEIIRRVNKELSHDNDSCMFVTVFLGILNLKSGYLRYVNAGHNPPLIIRDEKPPEFLSAPSSTIVGVEENAPYLQESVTLKGGDTLYIYTDGITEAFNEKGEMFTEENLKKELSLHRRDSVRLMAQKTLAKVKAHSAGVPQSDDITLLVIRYTGGRPAAHGKPAGDTFTVKNNPNATQKVFAHVEALAEKYRLCEDDSLDLRLVLEEAVTNIVKYAYRDDEEHSITVRTSIERETLTVEIRDDGVPFDPLNFPPPPLDTPLEKRTEGGLGIYLIKNTMDTLAYRREGDLNILTMTKKLRRNAS
jgi:sigma-B regulation protein RsbU (phosphoserine phosphatase)